MIDRDIWITANEMIKLYGEDAGIQAAIRADAMQQMDNEQGYSVWKRVVRAINELRSAEPTGRVN